MKTLSRRGLFRVFAAAAVAIVAPKFVAKAVATPPPIDPEKWLADALMTEEGRQALAEAMVPSIRASIEYHTTGFYIPPKDQRSPQEQYRAALKRRKSK